MATVAEIQAEIDPNGTRKVANIEKKYKVSATVDLFYVVGMNGKAGFSRWVQTTSSESAADQATAILNGLTA